MYLNVNLTPPPQSNGDGTCTTPKTPEILNSLMSLTHPPLPQNFAQSQSQAGTGDLLSPASSISTPGEELPSTPFGSVPPSHSKSSFYPCAGGSPVGLCVVPPPGSSPPDTPDLPSPVSTVEATKSALIKEGLKLQIRTKLQAAGITTDEVLMENKLVKDELTSEDEDRRLRRRERNKIAATKCRNKKKEKTTILLIESDSAEDQNVKLKSEIQRLTCEKEKLEKLLRDPNHQASCHLVKRVEMCHHLPSLPQVIVTPPDANSSPTAQKPATTVSSVKTTESSLQLLPAAPDSAVVASYMSGSSTGLSSTVCDPSTSAVSSIGRSVPSQSLCTTSQNSPPSLGLPVSSFSVMQDTSGQSLLSTTDSSQFMAPKSHPSQCLRYHPYHYHSQSGVGIQNDQVLYTDHHVDIQSGITISEKYYSVESPKLPENVISQLPYGFSDTVQVMHELVPSQPSPKSTYTLPKARITEVSRFSPYSCTDHPRGIMPINSHSSSHPRSMVGACDTGRCIVQVQESYVDHKESSYYPAITHSSM